MKFNIHGKKIEVTEAIKNYIEEKIGRLDKYFDSPSEITATVNVRVRNTEQIVEVTIPTKTVILRAEERNKDLYASIDLVTEKLERQIRKNKTRMHRKNKVSYADFNLNFDVELEEEKNIVKRKKIEMKPMDEEEAVLQMNLIDHDFFVFKNANTGNVEVVYKRKDGDFGIIEAE